MDNKTTLTDLYFLIRGKAGWLAECQRAGFSSEDILFLETLDHALSGYNPDDAIETWEREIESAGGHDVYFSDTDEEKMKILSERIANVYREYARSVWVDEPYVDRAVKLALSGVQRLEKIRRGIRGKQLHKDEMEKMKADPTYKSKWITDHDIERARAYPLERIIPNFEMAKAGYIQCRWHEDKRPSMLIKNGFGYCFACQKCIDSIGWLMDVESLSFIDAVRYLKDR